MRTFGRKLRAAAPRCEKRFAQLHNNDPKAPLTVRPTVYTPDGQSIGLDPLTLGVLGNATIDIGAQLAAKGQNQVSTGSAVFRYDSKNPGVLGVEVYEGNAAKSLSFTIPSTEKPYDATSQNAVFWLPSPDAEIYVALQNTSSQPIRVVPTVSLNGATVTMPSVLLAAQGSSAVYISKTMFSPASWRKNAVGGITLTQDGAPGSLNTGAWIEDDHLGFSTTLTFANPAVKGNALLGTQILVGAAGLALGLPPDLIVSSQLVLRNTGDQPVDAEGTLAFSDNNGGLANAPIAGIHLAPGEVRSIDLAQIKLQAGVPPQFVSASISLQYSGPSGALMGRVFGSSPDGAYGLYWALQPSAGWSYAESFWSTQGNWTPIFTVGNFASTDDEITVVLTSNQGTYTLPVLNLKPLESRTINIRQLLETQHPFPSGADFGGFKITGTNGKSRFIVKEHLIDPIAKLATPFYGTYQYVIYAFLWETNADLQAGGYSSYSNAAGTSSSMNMGASLSGAQQPDYTQICPDSGQWGSNDTSLATLSFTGCYGTVSGISIGTAYVWAESTQITDPQGDQGPMQPQVQVKVGPRILLNGSDITGATTNVVVGQQISLSLTTGGTIQTVSWTVPGTTTGGYTAGNTSGSTTIPNFNQASPTFYWVDSGSSRTVSVSVTLTNGNSGNSSCTFNVVAPTGSMSPSATGTSNIVIAATQEGPVAEYGSTAGGNGVTLQTTTRCPRVFRDRSNGYKW